MDYDLTAMGTHRHKRQLRGWMVRFAALVAVSCSVLVGGSSSALASSAPSIQSVSVTGITEHDATLEAQINPNGLETTYEFQLTSPACQSEWPVTGPCMAISGFPLPSAIIPAGSGEQTVRVDINNAGKSLRPGTWYEYAVTASNADGTVTGYNAGEGPGIGRNFAGGGGEQNFKTLSANAAPSEVQIEPAEAIPGGAKLKGELDPGGLPTTYYFEYLGDNAVECLGVGVENCWPHTASMGPITGDSQQQVPPVEVTGLRMGETYRYRLVASNANGTVQSKVATFTVGFSPVISSLGPNHGPTSGGTTVTIHGEPFENARSVHFGAVEGKILHEECDDECEIMPYRTLVVESPPHVAGTVDVTVETAQGVSVASPGDKFTYGPPGEPSIESESVSDLAPTDATLEAKINTEGLETSYQFRLSAICGGKGACLVVVNYPLPSGLLLGSFVDQSVSLDLNTAGITLQPGGTYTYSVSATNASGTTESAPQNFTTPENVVQPLSITTSSLSGAGQPAGSTTNSGDQPAGSGGSSSSPTPSIGVLGAQTGNTTELKPLTSAQRLANALKQCDKQPKHKRAECKKQARKQYPTTASKARKLR